MTQMNHGGALITSDFITLTKLNSDLTINWTVDLNTIPLGADEISAQKVMQTRDDGYLIAGKLIYDAAGTVDQTYILKVDSTGQQTWMKVFPTTQLSNIFGIEEHSNGYITSRRSVYYSSNTERNYCMYKSKRRCHLVKTTT